MKRTTIILILTFFLFGFGRAQTTYMVISYHQLLPGATMSDATQVEKAWKAIHQIRKEKGLITNWEMYTMFPSWGAFKTADIEFDYITITRGNNPDNIIYFDAAMFEQAYKKDPQLSAIIDKGASKIVRQEMLLSEASVGSFKPDQIYLFEVNTVTPTNMFEYQAFEKKMAIVHEDRVATGTISHWSFWQRFFPSAGNGLFEFTTICGFPTISAFREGGYREEAIKKALGMGFGEAYMKYIPLRETKSSWLANLTDKI